MLATVLRVAINIGPILQMRKQRLKTIQWLTHGHTQRKWQKEALAPGTSDSIAESVTDFLAHYS